jgi:hypothetical protein
LVAFVIQRAGVDEVLHKAIEVSVAADLDVRVDLDIPEAKVG